MTNIYIEARNKNTSEYVFVESLLRYLGIDDALYQILPVNGKDNLKHMQVQFMQNTLLGGKNIIIFDADTPQTKGGYGARRDEIYQVLKDNGMIAEDLFLFPNNQDDGMFENLLEKLMLKETHKKWVDCYSDYEKCLGEDYLSPNLKGKLFTYISSQKDLSNSKRKKLGQGQWLFEDKRFWDFDNVYLDSLKRFLLEHVG